MKLLTLQQLADELGLSYKRVYNRLNQSTGIINVAGKSIPAAKDKGQWYIWRDDFDNAAPIEPAKPKPMKPAPIKNIKAKGKPGLSGFSFIDPSKSGMG